MKTRRSFLKALTASGLALPYLDSLGGFAHAAEEESPRRLLLITVPLSLYKQALVPEAVGAKYEATEYLSLIKEFRNQTTVISGLDHPGVNGGHVADTRIFTAVPSAMKNARSLDQHLANSIGTHTRYDSLVLAASSNQTSWTNGGTMIPAQQSMAKVYQMLFTEQGSDSVKQNLKAIEKEKSLTNLMRRQAEALKPGLSRSDQAKLAEYFESVESTEKRLIKSESWVHQPKPKVDIPMPEDPKSKGEIITQMRNACDIIHLAFKTDSTRVISTGWFQQNEVNIDGVVNGYHPLSHHGNEPNNVTQLKMIEGAFFKELNALLTNLRNTIEGNHTLLDRTTILITSNLGNASNHSNKDLPVLLIGGGFDHGRHLAFDPNTTPAGQPVC